MNLSVSTISELDLDILKQGFRVNPTPSQSRQVEEVLKKFGYERISARPPTKNRPGRKRKDSINPTENEIHIRIEFLRLVLGDAAKKLSEARLLSAVVELLSLYKEQCSAGLYLTQVERARMQNIAGNSGDAVAQMSGYPALRPELPVSWGEEDPTESELTLWLAHLAKAETKSSKDAWAGMVDEAISQPASELDENQLYAAIRVQLGLSHEGRSGAECKEQIENLKRKRPRNQSAIAERDSKIGSLETDIWIDELHDQNISRNKTLWSATAGLLNMRNVVDSCWFVRVDSEIEHLYAFIRCCSYRMDLRQIPTVLAELETLFLEAVNRQGRSPFVSLFNEEIDPGPAWVPEDGQLKGLPPGNERVDPIDAVVRVVKAEGADGIKKAAVVKSLMQGCRCSKATAYEWISAAVKQKKINELEKTKRYVVAS